MHGSYPWYRQIGVKLSAPEAVDLGGAVTPCLAAFAGRSLKLVEPRGFRVQPPATVLLHLGDPN
jgi:hypothetical protein